jgi:CheY-like chemotaxis protein
MPGPVSSPWFGSGPSEELRQRLKPLRVLIVEDFQDAADSLAILLRLAGYEVELTRTGLAALERAPRWQPDVVLLDLKLPDLHGYQVAARLRANALLAGVTLIAVTGYARPIDFRHSATAGLELHLVKPVDPEELLAVLGRIRPRGQQRPAETRTTG